MRAFNSAKAFSISDMVPKKSHTHQQHTIVQCLEGQSTPTGAVDKLSLLRVVLLIGDNEG